MGPYRKLQIKSAYRNAQNFWFVSGAETSQRSARRALMVGVVANAIGCGFSVFMGWMVATVAPQSGPAPVLFFVIAAVMGWSAYWLKRRRSVIAGWAGFALYAALLLLSLGGLFSSFSSGEPPFLILLPGVLGLAVLTACTFLGVRGARAVRLQEAATLPPPSEANVPRDGIDFAYLYTSFEGRINRKPYWIGYSLIFVLWLSFPLLSLVLKPGRDLLLLISSIRIVTWYPFTALFVKRLHDLNWSGYLAALFVVPAFVQWLSDILGFTNPFTLDHPLLYGAAVAIYFPFFLVLGCRRGSVGPNAHGPDPLGGQS